MFNHALLMAALPAWVLAVVLVCFMATFELVKLRGFSQEDA